MNALADKLLLLLLWLLLAAMLLDAHTFACGNLLMLNIGKIFAQNMTSEQTLLFR